MCIIVVWNHLIQNVFGIIVVRNQYSILNCVCAIFWRASYSKMDKRWRQWPQKIDQWKITSASSERNVSFNLEKRRKSETCRGRWKLEKKKFLITYTHTHSNWSVKDVYRWELLSVRSSWSECFLLFITTGRPLSVEIFRPRATQHLCSLFCSRVNGLFTFYCTLWLFFCL